MDRRPIAPRLAQLLAGLLVVVGLVVIGITLPNDQPAAALEPGWMTGGGSILENGRVTHGFSLRCDAGGGPNNLQVNWNGSSFHLEELDSAVWTDAPSIEPPPPDADFDTYEGSGSGRYNGVAGARARWTFTDAGEPGNRDFAEIVVSDANGEAVLSVAGELNRGNHQAHGIAGRTPPPRTAPPEQGVLGKIGKQEPPDVAVQALPVAGAQGLDTGEALLTPWLLAGLALAGLGATISLMARSLQRRAAGDSALLVGRRRVLVTPVPDFNSFLDIGRALGRTVDVSAARGVHLGTNEAVYEIELGSPANDGELASAVSEALGYAVRLSVERSPAQRPDPSAWGRLRLPRTAGLAVLVLAALIGLLLARQGADRRSDVLAAVDPSAAEQTIIAAAAAATATPTPTFTPVPTDTPVPPVTPTPLPAPTAPQAPAAVDPVPPAAVEQPPPPPQALTEGLDAAFTSRVFALVNAERTSRGLAAVAPNAALARAAADYAVLLMQYDSLSHTAAGTTLSGRVRAAGYTSGPPLGEVLWLAVGVLPPERTVADWMASPPHREVILSSSYRVAGASCYFRQGARWETRCVMDFGG